MRMRQFSASAASLDKKIRLASTTSGRMLEGIRQRWAVRSLARFSLTYAVLAINIPRKESEEIGLISSATLHDLGIPASCTAGQIAICFLSIGGRFTSRRDILASCAFYDFLRPFNFIGRIAMYR
jgi:hypothetical protein